MNSYCFSLNCIFTHFLYDFIQLDGIQCRTDSSNTGSDRPSGFFGQRQHGLPTLKVADLSCDMALLKEAQNAAEELLRSDPMLAKYSATAQRVAEMFESRTGAMN